MADFHFVAALVAGFLATVAMSLAMNLAKAGHMTEMPPMPLMTGSMMTGRRATAMGVGALIHYGIMGTLVFGTVYAALFQAFDSTSWWAGTSIGAVHGLLVGLVAMPMMPAMHPRVEHELTRERQPVTVGGEPTVAIDRQGEVHIAAPGVLGNRWGGMTPVGIVVGHAIYGLVLAVVYDAML